MARDESEHARLLETAFGVHTPAMHAIARRYVGGDHASDVVQDVFERLLRHPHRFDPDRGTIGQYLRTVTRGVSLDHLRSHASRSRRDGDHSMDHRPHGHDVHDLVMADLDGAAIVASLDSLTALERGAVRARCLEGLSYREVAVRFGVPESTAKSRVRSGLAKLREERRRQ